MNKPTLIDKKRIGVIEFEAVVFEDENKLDAFAIFFQNQQEPILLFKQNIGNNRIDITINQDLVNILQNLKSKDLEQRKSQYKEFKTFALDAEQKAKEMFLKDKRLNYISDIQLIKFIEQTFLID